MWGSDYPHSESTFPQSRKILSEILAGVPDDEQAKIAGDVTRPPFLPKGDGSGSSAVRCPGMTNFKRDIAKRL